MRSVTRVISFTSGKGGTGKTTTVVNIGCALAQQGRSVMILDADLSLANIDIALGLHPKQTIHDVLRGRANMRDIVLDGPYGVKIIPAASGVSEMCQLSASDRVLLTHQIEEVAEGIDYLLIDTQAGIGAEVMYFNGASAETVCVVTPDPTALTDAYALIKILSRQYGEKAVSVIVNNVMGLDVQNRTIGRNSIEIHGQEAFKRLSAAVERFLHTELSYLGCVPADRMVGESIRAQKALTQLYPSSAAGLAFNRLADTLDQSFFNVRVKGGMQFFFQQLLEMSSNGYSAVEEIR